MSRDSNALDPGAAEFLAYLARLNKSAKQLLDRYGSSAPGADLNKDAEAEVVPFDPQLIADLEDVRNALVEKVEAAEKLLCAGDVAGAEHVLGIRNGAGGGK